MTTIAAIPTKYAGVQFRSRLEARWAAFFDELGFSWEYEPIDLNGWIPDFRLTFCKKTPVLVEVKPSWDGDARTEDLAKINRSMKSRGSKGEERVLLLGSSVPDPVDDDDDRALPCVGEVHWYASGLPVMDDVAFLGDTQDSGYDFVMLAEWGHGTVSGDSVTAAIGPKELRSYWAQAGNAVQYKAPRS